MYCKHYTEIDALKIQTKLENGNLLANTSKIIIKFKFCIPKNAGITH